MPPKVETLPVFALEASSGWDDLRTRSPATPTIAYTLTLTRPDDPSFFFPRTPAAVQAFNRELRVGTR